MRGWPNLAQRLHRARDESTIKLLSKPWGDTCNLGGWRMQSVTSKLPTLSKLGVAGHVLEVERPFVGSSDWSYDARETGAMM